ncbi:hypothetical protein PPACK8108_LOCUS16080, partial [Phakopsora pachyrhizi]
VNTLKIHGITYLPKIVHLLHEMDEEDDIQIKFINCTTLAENIKGTRAFYPPNPLPPPLSNFHEISAEHYICTSRYHDESIVMFYEGIKLQMRIE